MKRHLRRKVWLSQWFSNYGPAGRGGGEWVAQSVKHLTLDRGSGQDLRVQGQGPESAKRSAGTWFEILSPSSLPLPPTPALLAHALSL